MATVLDFPRKAIDGASAAALAPLRPFLPAGSVDEWGRDEHLIDALTPFVRLRWRAIIDGEQHLPARKGALLVTNNRTLSFSPLSVAWSLARLTGRPVRFIGHPDIAPLGPAMRRLGAILQHPDEVRGALHHDELVVLGTSTTPHPRQAGRVDSAMVGAAVLAGVPVIPVASMSSPFGRRIRVHVGAPVRPRTKRRGPLAETELADITQHHLQRILDELGGVRTGIAPLDWVGEG